MRAATYRSKDIPTGAVLVDLARLQDLLSCGYSTAHQIATSAGAIVKVGRRKLYNIKKIQAYIDQLGG